MVVSVDQSIDIFFALSQVKKMVVWIVFALSSYFLVLKWSFEACPESGWDRIDKYGWLVTSKTEKLKKNITDLMLWLGFNKMLKLLIGHENM